MSNRCRAANEYFLTRVKNVSGAIARWEKREPKSEGQSGSLTGNVLNVVFWFDETNARWLYAGISVMWFVCVCQNTIRSGPGVRPHRDIRESDINIDTKKNETSQLRNLRSTLAPFFLRDFALPKITIIFSFFLSLSKWYLFPRQ